VNALVKRGTLTTAIKLALPAGWRKLDDIAWRASSWELRRMGLGAMYLKTMTPEQRAEQKLPATGMALRAEHVGQFAPHDVAKKAGVVKDDVLISFNGRTDFTRETDLLAYALNEIPVGAKVPAVFMRNGEKIAVELHTR